MLKANSACLATAAPAADAAMYAPDAPNKKLISVVSGCYNEQDNIRECHERVKKVFAEIGPRYRYEHIFIDNASKRRHAPDPA